MLVGDAIAERRSGLQVGHIPVLAVVGDRSGAKQRLWSGLTHLAAKVDDLVADEFGAVVGDPLSARTVIPAVRRVKC